MFWGTLTDVRSAATASLLLLVACVDAPATGEASRGLAPEGTRTVERAPAIPETEQGATFDVVVGDRTVFEDVKDASPEWVVDRDGVLWRIAAGEKTRVIDRARRVPVVHPRGAIVVRAGDEPGRTSLWLLSAGEPRAIAASTGADDRPFVLPDGRVVFVSTRSSVASVWILDAALTEARQLTNVGLVAGRGLDGFVPPPAGEIRFVAGRVEYDAGGGWWSLDPNDGKAERLP